MEACRRRSDGDGDLDATELRLGLPGTEPGEKPSPPAARAASKRALEEDAMCPSNKNEPKAQVAGWPPVPPYRRNISMQMRRSEVDVDGNKSAAAIYVKVSMDGAPYLRKIDLKVYRGYKDLRENLEDMFKCFSLGEYVITYEDKDGDWMMVGDVPWEMFVSACKRLRIMKGSEARGLRSS